MSRLSIKLQTKALAEMATRKVFTKSLAGFTYEVHAKVFKGSTDSELLCSAIKIGKDQSLWDIGTGTGLAALTAKKMGARYVLATDLNPYAVKNAKRNSELLNLDIEVKKADIFGNINKRFDIITFNPPFTNHPAKNDFEISFWDKDNMAVKRFFGGLKKHLNKNGYALVSWSSFGKIYILKKIARDYGFALEKVGERKGKRGLTYYVFKVNLQVITRVMKF
jgi:release factor glutamine methyltransferase